jgi:hypothetical protein
MSGTLAILLLSGNLQAADCDKTWPASTLAESLGAVEQAFADFDKAAVTKGYVKATNQLRCLHDPLAPELAAQLHRVTGLVRFLDHEDQQASTAFAAARVIQPDYALPETIAPAGHPLLKLWAATDVDALPIEPLAPAASGRLLRDGRPAKQVRRALPAVLQLIDEQEQPAWTVLVQPGEPLPAYEVAAPPPPEPVATEPSLGLQVQPPPAPGEGNGVSAPLLVAAGVTAVVSAATYGLAWKARADWESAGSLADADTAYDRNHTMCIVSGASLVATAGLGVGAVVVARF